MSVNEQHSIQLAPWLPIPSRAVSVVEHPCIIKNVDKGITSLGGPVKLSKALRSKPIPPPENEGDAPDLKLPHFISASLRPDDPYAKRILGTPVTTENLLLKVTVPKRTGRKRKRGSDDPFLDGHETQPRNGDTANMQPSTTPCPYVNATTVFQSLRDNVDKYTVVPAGVIDESHRFRTLPDLQLTSSRDSTMISIQENLMPLRYSQIKNFNLNTDAGVDLSKGIAVPAEFLQMAVQYNYRFQQNPFVKYVGDDEVVNVQKRIALEGYYFVKNDAETIPTGPKSSIPPEYTLTPYMRGLIASVRAELAQRPIITRHLLYNTIGWDKRDRIREVAPYCGYFFESGPWREALILFGIDPRTDPKYRKYQTISFMSFLKIGTARSRYMFDKHVRELARMPATELQTQHTFDGVNVSHTGNLFQFCDISDPLIRKILDTDDIRTTCAPTFQGWYHVGTWAKATVILKDKMNRIVGGEEPDDSIYQRILTWPENWDDQEIYVTYRHEMFDAEIHKIKIKEHTVMNTVRAAARNPRYAFEQMESREERAHNRTSDGNIVDVEEVEEVEVPEDLTEAPDGADAMMTEEEGDESEGAEDDEDDFEEDDARQDRDSADDDGSFEEVSDSDADGESQKSQPLFAGLFKGR